MIVDLHTHIWESPDQLGRGAAQRLLRSTAQPWDRPDASPTAHDVAMEPVQHAVILGFESRMLGASISAEQVARYVERKPGKYLGFAGIDPLMGPVKPRIEQAIRLGLVGVTISPAAQGFHPSHTAAWPLYEICSDRGLPLLVHGVTHVTAEKKMEFAQPHLLDEIAREFPKLKIIISQVGHPWIEETLVMLGKHRNVYADLSNVVTRSWQLYTLLLSAHQQGVMDRLLFGSDFPFCTPQKAITTIYSVNTLTQGTMLPSVPREQLRSIVERDVLEILGLRKKASEPAKGTATAEAPAPIVVPTAALPAPVSPAAPKLNELAVAPNTGNNGSASQSAELETPKAIVSPAQPASSKATGNEIMQSPVAANDDRSTTIEPYELEEGEAPAKPGDGSAADAKAPDDRSK